MAVTHSRGISEGILPPRAAFAASERGIPANLSNTPGASRMMRRMLRTHRQTKRDDGKHRLRQLWLVWLALVAAMFAFNPAPRPGLSPAPIVCIDNAARRPLMSCATKRTTSGDSFTAGRSARLTHSSGAPHASLLTHTSAALLQKIARQILPGRRSNRARMTTSAHAGLSPRIS